MRITNNQVVQFEKLLTEHQLQLSEFNKHREDDRVRFDFKDDYFSFQIVKEDVNRYQLDYRSVYNKEMKREICNWESTYLKFKTWCEQIRVDVESGRQISKPAEKEPIPKIERHPMSDVIKKISPKFDLIFNEAFQAEQYGLNEICGLGYRKAFEFLIKDYVMRNRLKDETVRIKNMGISEVVNEYITDVHIKLIVKRVLWLGNDHAHYLPVFKNKTIDDLKSLIYTTMLWIEARQELERLERHAKKIEKQMPYKGKKPMK